MVDLIRVNVASYNPYFDLWFNVCSQDPSRSWLEFPNFRFQNHDFSQIRYPFTPSNFRFAKTDTSVTIVAISCDIVMIASGIVACSVGQLKWV